MVAPHRGSSAGLNPETERLAESRQTPQCALGLGVRALGLIGLIGFRVFRVLEFRV